MTFQRVSIRFVIGLAVCLAAPTFARAEVFGGIEIGAKGIRAIAVDFNKDGTPKILSVDNKNTTLVADLAANKQYSPQALKATADLVGGFASKIRTEFKVPEGRLYVVGSSGLFSPIDGNEPLIKTCKEQLIQTIRAATGITMDFVSIQREAELTITAVVPTKDRPEAVLLDIGSGNTKGGAELPSGGLLTFGVQFGTVSFYDRVKKEAAGGDLVKTAAVLRKEILVPKLRASLEGKAELLKRKRVYLAGGSVWAMTTFTKPADRRDLVALQIEDVATYYGLLVENPKGLPNTPLAATASDEAKRAALKDMDQVRKTFTRDQMIAGAEIIKALVETFDLGAPQKELLFARNAYIGWILGYTMDKAVTK